MHSCTRWQAVALATRFGNTPTRTGHGSSIRDPRRERSTCLIVLLTNEQALERKLATGEIPCPDCGARVVAWGFARRRVLRTLGGSRTIVPRRTRCNSCKKTHVVLPSEVVARRNKERTNRLLKLMRVAINGKASEIAFAHSIREALLAGLVLPKQMSIVDVGTGPASCRRASARRPAPKPSLWR